MGKKNGVLENTMWVGTTLLALALGLFFYDGGFVTTTFFEMFPPLVHKIIGGVLVASTVLGVWWRFR